MERTGRRVTLAEVARDAGVSIAAVSAILNDAGGTVRTSAATQSAVRAAAARLGYAPNHAARSLVRRRTNRITLVVNTLANPYYADIAVAARAAAGDAHEVNVVEASRPETERQVLEDLRGGSSDAVIVATTRHAADAPVTDALRDLVRRGVPAVMLIDHSPDPAIPAIRIDDEAGAYLATRHLLDLGHRRVAHLTQRSVRPVDDGGRAHSADRFRGYRRALAEAGVAFEPGWLLGGELSMAGGREMMHELLARPGARATAVFCFYDQIAIGALRALYERGVRVPEEMAVVGFDGVAPGAFTTPALTTVDHSRADLGRLGVETALALLDGRRPDRAERVLPVRLLVRESCGAAIGAAGAR